jgi:hypothetical protein
VKEDEKFFIKKEKYDMNMTNKIIKMFTEDEG